jgi:hypothetical protein
MLLAALIRGGRASFEAMGRELPSNADIESRIKFVKRWVSNKWTDYKVHFLPSISWLLQRLSRAGELVLAMDGSEVGNGCTALMLSVVWKSRAIPVCWVVRTGSKGHFPEEMHVALLDMAWEILPSDCRKVLLGDGEFDGCGLQARCRELGWEYVLRTSKDAVLHEDGEAFPFGRLSPAKGQRHFFLPSVHFTSKKYGPVNAVVWHGPKHKDPVFLITSMELPHLACHYYKKRFKIETLFGDLKSRGFNVHRTKVSDPERVGNLLMLACLAFILVLCFGINAPDLPYYAKFCRKDRCDCSVFTLGARALAYCVDNALQFCLDISKNFSSNSS